jgi:hypothetical protein
MTNTTQTAPTAALVRRIIQGEIDRRFSLNGQRIERQSTTVIEVTDGAGSRVTVRGQTNFTEGPWAVYEGQYGTWQATVSPTLRVRPTHPITR